MTTLHRRLARLCAVGVAFACLAMQASSQLVPHPSVDPFTGAFKCDIPLITIPGPNGSSYVITLNYSSDIRADEEASWVGYGWHLDAPSITRQRSGLPDDVISNPAAPGVVVMSVTRKGEIKTKAVGLHGGDEIGSTDISLGGNFTILCDRRSGLDAWVGVNAGVSFGFGSASMSLDTKGRFGAGLGLKLSEGFKTSATLFSYDPAARTNTGISFLTPFRGEISMRQYTVRVGIPAGWEAGANEYETTIWPLSSSYPVCGYLFIPNVISKNPGALTPTNPSEYMLDYLVERERPLSTDHPTPLPVPLSAHDDFIVSAPGLSGKFRAHHQKPIRVRPPKEKVDSEMDEVSLSFKGIIFPGAGFGTKLPGSHDYTIVAEDHDTEDDHLMQLGPVPISQGPFFRFYGDLAGSVRFSSDDAKVYDINKGVSNLDYYPLNRYRMPLMNRPIEWDTIGTIAKLQNDALSEYADMSIGKRYGRMRGGMYSAPYNLICSFTIRNDEGIKYRFAEPLFNHTEFTAQWVMEGSNVQRPSQRIYYPSSTIDVNSVKSLTSKSLATPYVFKWYVTEITTPDYIDVGDDGADTKDIGGWTRFWYSETIEPSKRQKLEHRWRVPYAGFLLERNDVDDNEDDVLSFSQGVRDVRFLEKIETATHRAIFYESEGLLDRRQDAIEPQAGLGAQLVPTPRPWNPLTDKRPPMLKKIELYAKSKDGSPDQLLRTVHFKYDYSLASNNPASEEDPANPGNSLGKLTLRKVWVEEQLVREATIQPIDFFYTYPVTAGAVTSATDVVEIGELATRYGSSVSFPSYTTAKQNPAFNPEAIDAWGYGTGVQPFLGSPGAELQTLRYTPLQNRQVTAMSSGDRPDPGMWRLKTIKLPSGLRVVPVYESRTYSWVQDKPASMMVPLASNAADVSIPSGFNRYAVDLAAVGVNTASMPERFLYASKFIERFVEGCEPIYFNFRYKSQCGSTDDHYNVRGYCWVKSATLVNTGSWQLKLELGDMQTALPAGPQDFSTMEDLFRTTPFRIAMKYWKTFRGRCYGRDPNDIDFTSLILRFPEALSAMSSVDYNSAPDMPQLQPQLSHIRMPVAIGKAGDGARVKKLLHLSPSGLLDNDDESALGTEYIYGELTSSEETASWGVATDEPAQIREDNAIIGIRPEFWPILRDEAFDDTHIAWAEGPAAHSLYPAPSVGYEKIISRSIDQAATTAGYSVQRFVTCRTVPSVVELGSPNTIYARDHDILSLPMYSLSYMRIRASQSYSFLVQPYHGLPLGSEHYTGVFGSTQNILISSSLNEYTMPRESVPLLFDLHRGVFRRRIGEHMDFVIEGRRIEEYRGNGRGDFSVEFTPPTPVPLPIISFGASVSFLDHEMLTYATSKVIEVAPMLKNSITGHDGIVDTMEVVARHSLTGMPIVTRTTDSYHRSLSSRSNPSGSHIGSVVNVAVPAFVRGEGMPGSMYQRLGFASRNYGSRWGELGVQQALVGNCLLSMSGNVVHINFSTTIDHTERQAYLKQLFSVGDRLMIKDATKTAYVEVENIILSSSPVVRLYLRRILGTMPTGAPTFTVLSTGRQNRLSEPSTITQLYSSPALDAAIGRSWTMEGMELYHVETLIEWSRISVASWNGWQDPFLRYQGTSAFAVTPRDVTIQDTDAEGCGTTEGFPAQSLSRFWLATRFASPTTIQIGLINPYVYNHGTPAPAIDLNPDSYYKTCFYDWLDTYRPEAWYVPGTGEVAMDQYDWDNFRQFKLNDLGYLYYQTHEPPATGTGSGNITLREGGFASNSAIDGPFISHVAIPYNEYPIYNGVTQIGSHLLPATQMTWVTGSLSHAGGIGVVGVVPPVQDAAGTYSNVTPYSAWETTTTESPAKPAGGQGSGYIRSNFIKKVNNQGKPTEIVDITGLYSTLQCTPDLLETEAVFGGAENGTAWFESFERCTTCTAPGFTGNRSRGYYSSFSVVLSPPAHVTTTSYASNTTVRCWVRLKHAAHPAGTLTLAGVSIADEHVIAMENGWYLLEVTVSGSSLASGIGFNFSGSDSLWLDDLVLQPAVSSVTASVTDHARRPVATLDDNWMPSRIAYDARGRVAKSTRPSVVGAVAGVMQRVSLPREERTSETVSGGASASPITMLLANPALNELDSTARSIEESYRKVDSTFQALPRIPKTRRSKKPDEPLIQIKANKSGVSREGSLPDLPMQVPKVNVNDSTVIKPLQREPK